MDGPVIATSGHQPSVLADPDTPHFAGIPPQCRQQASRLSFPQPDCALRTLIDTAVTNHAAEAVRRIPDICRWRAAQRPMAHETSRQARVVGLPDAEGPVVTAACEQLPISAERH